MNEAELKKLKNAIVNYGNYKRESGEVVATKRFYTDDKILYDALHHYGAYLITQTNYAWNAIANIIEERTEEKRYPKSLDDIIKLESENND